MRDEVSGTFLSSESTISDTIEVGIRTSLDFTSSPMTKGVANRDLYGIRVYQKTPTGMIMMAYGTFDDLSLVAIKMAKTSKYGIDLTYIPNGKNIVYEDTDGHYGVPFSPVWTSSEPDLNQVKYIDPGEAVWSLSYGAVQEVGITDYRIQSNNWSTVRRYQGIALCDPTEDNIVDIDLYLQMVGFKISVTEFETGTITFGGDFGHKYTVTPDANNEAVIDIEVCMESMPSIAEYPWDQEFDKTAPFVDNILNSQRNQTVRLTYSDGTDETVLYYNFEYKVTRNTRYNMSFSLLDAIEGKTINSNIVDEGEMTETYF
jgi:hypothetical protein